MDEIRTASAFTAVEGDQWSEPPSLSWLAVAALLLGACSLGAVFSPLLWCLPLAGVGLAAAALISIRRDPRGRVGRGAAVAGLVLSLLFAAWGLSNYVTRQQMLYRQARVYSRQWLELVRTGQLQEAYQLQLPQRQRRAPATSLTDFYASDREIATAYDSFRRGEIVRELSERGAGAELRFVGDERVEAERESDSYTELVTQRYVLAGPDRPPLTFFIVLARTRGSADTEVGWRVLELKSEAGPR